MSKEGSFEPSFLLHKHASKFPVDIYLGKRIECEVRLEKLHIGNF